MECDPRKKLILKAAIQCAIAACAYAFQPARALAAEGAGALSPDMQNAGTIGIAVVCGLLALAGLTACLRLRVRLKDALRTARALRALPGVACSFHLAPDGTLSLPGISPPARELLGMIPGNTKGDMAQFSSLVHVPDRARFNDGMAASARDLSPWRVEFRVNHPDKGLIWIEGHLHPERDADGGTTWNGFISDTTGRKHDDIRLRMAASVFKNTQEGIVVTTPSGEILAVNPAFSRITGYAEADLAGQNIRILKSGRHDSEFYHGVWQGIAEKGFWQGEIWNRRKNGEVYPELLSISAVRNDAGEVATYVGTFADITKLKDSESRLVHLAHHDALTGLPNRVLLLARLNHAIKSAKRKHGMGAVLFLDLDRFKAVNDSLGHPAGDELLLAVTARIGNRLRGTDTLARLGGDEFIVLLEEIADANDAARLAQSLLDQFEQPYTIAGGHEVRIGTSIGISIFPGESALADEVVKHADAALYRAKEEGRGTYRFYTSSLTEKANVRIDMERRLRRALERDEFVLHYQPLLSVPDQRIVGVEALVRWHEDGRRLVLPGDFIPLAEETGVIIPLGERILHMACRQAKEWLDAGIDAGRVAVNLSTRQFHLADLDAVVGSVLRDTGLPARFLELELTENAIADHRIDAGGRLGALRKLGARISIDDFGTGYSSLANLRRLPVDRLKIDISFMRGIPDNTGDVEMIAAIIALAKALKLETVGEGVETAAQLDFLKRLGCSHAQGHFFCRPMAPAEITELLLRGFQPPR